MESTRKAGPKKTHLEQTQRYCSGFRYECNEIFVLGVVFFLQTNFDLLTGNFLTDSKSIIVLSLTLKKYFSCDHFS